MADTSEPLSTTVPETTTIDTRADPESAASLNKSFEDFWSEQDIGEAPASKEAPKEAPPAAPAPAAPGEGAGAGQETRAEPAAPSEPPLSDIDKMELGGTSGYTPRPEHQEQFKKIKELWKADQRRAEDAAKALQAAQNELAEARRNTMTPELRADYESAVQLRRRFDYTSDPEFQTKFQTPIQNQFDKILNETINYLPDRNLAINWANDIRQNWGPDAVNRDWWVNAVVAKVPDELNRVQLLNSIAKLTDLQQERNAEVGRRTQDQGSFETWRKEQAAQQQQWLQREIKAGIDEEEKRVAQILPVDISQAKTAEERQAMEAHNQRFQKLNDFFINQLQDIRQNGPRAWVRVAIEATRTQIMNDQIVNLEKELKEAATERDKYKTELEKITGARRRLAQSSGSQPSAEPRRNGQGLSIKDLDPRKSLSAYFDEIDRNQ